MKTGIELIAQERQEQIEKHGRTVEKDVRENRHYQLSEAAGLLSSLDMDDLQGGPDEIIPTEWSPIVWAKMWNKGYKQRLIIAGALIAAELDRIQADEL